jgi:hypothetical protein
MNKLLINTPLQRGDQRLAEVRNCFNSFGALVETVETVLLAFESANTPLKWGVNERAVRGHQTAREVSKVLATSEATELKPILC